MAAACAGVVLLGGCAEPGPPLPPTLNLPQVVTTASLSAVRVGDTVQVRWTTPSQTMDKLRVKGPMTAVICRDAADVATRAKTAAPTCTAVKTLQVTPGDSEASDALPPALATGPVRLLAYRVELRNAAGRTAGASATVYAAAGQAPAELADFSAVEVKDGIALRWRPEPGSAQVELDRVTLKAAPATGERTRQSALPARPSAATARSGSQTREPAQARFTAGDGADAAGGTVDRTAELGAEYRYTAQRVERVKVGARELELRSAPTAGVEVALKDVFPPETPTGLVTAPGFADSGQPVIDLSWIPVMERGAMSRVAGYRVYRREGKGEWKRIGPELVAEPAFRDAEVTAGHSYEYRVTAVSIAGVESQPSGTAQETAQAP